MVGAVFHENHFVQVPPNTRGEWPVSCEAGRSNSVLRSLEIVRYFGAFRMTIREAWPAAPAECGLDTGPARFERGLIPRLCAAGCPRLPALTDQPINRNFAQPSGSAFPPPMVGSEKVRYRRGGSSSTKNSGGPGVRRHRCGLDRPAYARNRLMAALKLRRGLPRQAAATLLSGQSFDFPNSFRASS